MRKQVTVRKLPQHYLAYTYSITVTIMRHMAIHLYLEHTRPYHIFALMPGPTIYSPLCQAPPYIRPYARPHHLFALMARPHHFIHPHARPQHLFALMPGPTIYSLLCQAPPNIRPYARPHHIFALMPGPTLYSPLCQAPPYIRLMPGPTLYSPLCQAPPYIRPYAINVWSHILIGCLNAIIKVFTKLDRDTIHRQTLYIGTSAVRMTVLKFGVENENACMQIVE